MNPVFHVRHETAYRYDVPVLQSFNEARVSPRTLPWQSVAWNQFTVTPNPTNLRTRTDYFGNSVVHFAVQHPHDESSAVSTFEVHLHPDKRPVAAQSTTEWRPFCSKVGADIRPWVFESPRIPLLPEVDVYAREVFSEQTGLMEGCRAFMSRMKEDFTFDPNSSSVTTGVAEAFAARRGVCQDFSHIMICGLRSLDLPARYVSGYIETLPPPGKEKLVGADASHAWVSVFDPCVGWVDFDPTNDLVVYDQHITLGWGRDFTDIPPLKGVVIGGDHQELDVSVDVRRVDPATPIPHNNT